VKFFKLELPKFPVGSQNYQQFWPIINAIQTIAIVLDNFISGSRHGEELTVTVQTNEDLPEGKLIFVNADGVATTDTSEGVNAVYVGFRHARFRSAIAKLPGLGPGTWYWLELPTGNITSTPNLNFRVQLLGVAVTTSDLHFIYSPPTQ
jgi:hypothetical protein